MAANPRHGWPLFGVLPTTHAETNANKMRPRALRAVRRFHACLSSRLDRNIYELDESRLF